MGNKRLLAGEVAAICEDLEEDRPLVDLFGGMCNVAGAQAPSGRTVYVNDVQSYAELTARCLIASPKGPPDREKAGMALRSGFMHNRLALRRRFAKELRREREALASGRVTRLASAAREWRHGANDIDVAEEIAGLRADREPPDRLCTLSFAWGYFGLAQCIDIDSLRFAIDNVSESGFGSSDISWLRLAMLQTASRIASTPGHFAQFLRPTSATASARIVSYRKKPVWDWFLDDVSMLRPYGTTEWRRKNRVRRGEALKFVRNAEKLLKGRPAIFYADPPYSKEHYSRFYHVLETLERYDYPEAVGAGRYRPDRFHSDFAIGSKVKQAIEGLFAEVAAAKGVLLFSYPSSGLLGKSGASVEGLLGEHFACVSRPIDRPAQHSTLGGRHGAPTRAVYEQLWLAR